MRRYLVVAHRTLGGAELLDHLRSLRAEHPCRFHLLVPVEHPFDHPWTEGEVDAAAQQRLDEILERLAEMGIGADGEIGDSNPVYAVSTVLRREGRQAYSGIIVSTLPKATSRWLARDVPGRISRAHPGLPVTHITSSDVFAPG